MGKTHDLSLTLPAAEVSREVAKYTLKATDSQLKDLETRFSVVSIEAIEASVKVYTREGPGIMVEGSVKAQLVQSCITTLKDVPETIDTPLTLLLVDSETANRMDEDESFMANEEPEYDALEGDTVDIGEIVAQTVAISLNPYPRAEGATLSSGKNKNISVNEPELEKKNPFAILQKLKDES